MKIRSQVSLFLFFPLQGRVERPVMAADSMVLGRGSEVFGIYCFVFLSFSIYCIALTYIFP